MKMRCCLALLLALPLVMPMWAQVSSGSLVGDVLVPDVTITARSKTTGFARGTVTTEYGSYRIDELPPGDYSVTAEKAGFLLPQEAADEVLKAETASIP